MNISHNNLQSNEFVPKSLTTNVKAAEFTIKELSKPIVKLTNWCSPRINEELSNNPVLTRSEKNHPKNQQQMKQSEYNDPKGISNRYAKFDMVDPENKFLNCADINGKLYGLYNIFEDVEAGIAFKKQQPKPIKRLNSVTAKPLQSRKSKKDTKFSNPVNPNRFERESRRQPAKNNTEIADDSDENLEPRQCEAFTSRMEGPKMMSKEADTNNQQHKLETDKPRRPRGRPKKNANSSTLRTPDHTKKNLIEMGKEQESLKKISKKVSSRSTVGPESASKVSDYLENMELGVAFRKQQQKQQLQSSRRRLGGAGPRRLGRSKNCSTDSSEEECKKLDEPPVTLRRSARNLEAKLKGEQSLERNLQKEQEKPNSQMVVDWEKLDKSERVKEPPNVLRRSARIQAAKLKKQALEANLKKNLEKHSSRKVLPRRIARHQVCRPCPNCNSKTFLRPRLITYFECADINGKLYRLNDIFDDMKLGAAPWRKHQQLGTRRVRRVS